MIPSVVFPYVKGLLYQLVHIKGVSKADLSFSDVGKRMPEVILCAGSFESELAVGFPVVAK